MDGNRQNIENTETFPTRGKEQAQGQPEKNGSSFRRQTTSSPMRDTFTDSESAGNDLYTMAETIAKKFQVIPTDAFYISVLRYSIPCIKANATKCFPKAEVDKAMAEDGGTLGQQLDRSTGIPVSTSCACSVWARPKSAGSPSPMG